jgi:hypothetical protein
MCENKKISTKESIKYLFKEVLDALHEITRWDDLVYKEYEILLNYFKETNGNNLYSNDDKKKSLETLVTFLIKKTNIFLVFGDVNTGTSEIDQVAIRNDEGLLLEAAYKVTPKVLGIDAEYFLCECKNYKSSVGGTWVSKFNTLMNICGDCRLGILFSYHGLSGKEETWDDGHGIRKIIYKISPDDKKNYILDFNIRDFESILESKNSDNPIMFLDIIKAKKRALMSGGKNSLLYLPHDHEEKIKDIISKI